MKKFGLLLVLFFETMVCCYAIPKLYLDPASDIYSIGSRLEILEDKENKINLQEILSGRHDASFYQSQSKVPNYGYNTSGYWFRIALEKDGFDSRSWLFESEFLLIDSLELYIFEEGRITKKMIGDLYPIEKRDIQHRSLLIPLDFENTCTIFIHCSGNFTKRFPFNIVRERYFIEKASKDDAVKLLYYGLVFALLLYNLFLFFGIWDKSYLYYVLGFACLAFLGQMFIDGYSGLIFFRNYLRFNNISGFIGNNLFVIFILGFTRSYLNTKRHLPIPHKISYGIGALAGISIILALIAMNSSDMFLLASKSAVWVSGLAIIFMLTVGVWEWVKRVPEARFYMIAWSLFLLGAALFLSMVSGLLPETIITKNFIILGTASQMTLLSFGLADRFQRSEKERIKAQERAIKTLKENERLIADQNKILEEKVKQRTRELEESNAEIMEQREEIQAQRDSLADKTVQLEDAFMVIDAKNKDIMASIDYAKSIQSSILPNITTIKEYLTDVFVIYKPRDVVSGDFYWSGKQNGKEVLVAADCTGHGVPGALMSMIGSEILTELVLGSAITDPARILSELHKRVSDTLNQTETSNSDGMDLAIIEIDRSAKKMVFAGAKNPIIYFQNGELNIIKGDKAPIGGLLDIYDRKSYTNHTIDISLETCFYLFSDGYADQFGGKKERKYSMRALKASLTKIHEMNCKDQMGFLEDELQRWKGDHEQIDDILLIGGKI